ncbi:MAG TPA: thiamine phosphate synthase [Phycisphaerae bacterium]|nr:thiamine phosphate synthase [Phycisphaerae bacterium]
MRTAALRIIDANLNRAREGLRVLEEHARLVLDDAALTERLKRLRHGLVEASRDFGTDAMLTERDIQHDVGTRISTPSEQSRGDTANVAAAAGKRTSEALRCIEEYGKIICPQAAARIEQLRYELYAVEQDLLIAAPRRQQLRAARLHVLVTEALCSGPWLKVCEQVIAGGADAIQLREKSLTDRELLRRARELRELTGAHGALLFINDRPDIARLAGADGVHVGQDDLPVSEARRIGGGAMLVGKSTHSVEQARRALAESPDYIAVGPMFASKTKPDIGVQGPRLLAEVAKLTDLPIVAIGGIDETNAATLKPRGPLRVAVCQSVISAPDPMTAARILRDLVTA